jgi:DNA transformation protein
MSVRREFSEYAVELLSALGSVQARRMFGGVGLYCDGLMFALLAGDALYFKVDEENRAAFEAVGSEPFRYAKKGEWVTLSYWRAPDEALDSPEQALPWARSAHAAAVRAGARKQRPARTGAPRPARESSGARGKRRRAP